jgi:hypothetical protein
MKKVILVLALALMGASAFSQRPGDILERYLQVKDALVASDGDAAKLHAAGLHSAVSAAGPFGERDALLKGTQRLAKAHGLEKQRLALAEVSEILWRVGKSYGGDEGVVYYQYCPMKNAHWLSIEQAIRNPYYGAAMLTCGQTTETRAK